MPQNFTTFIFIAIFAGAGLFLLMLTKAANTFPQWSSLNKIYYATNQDFFYEVIDPASSFHLIGSAVNDLKVDLEAVSGRQFTVVTNAQPASGAIIARVDPNMPELAGKGREAFRLHTDGINVYITGKTPVAVRNGIYRFEHKLGYRMYYGTEAWRIKPKVLPQLATLDEVQDPYYEQREVGLRGSYKGDAIADWSVSAGEGSWKHRNSAWSDQDWRVVHNFSFVDWEDLAAQDPTAVCYDSQGNIRQLRPDHPLVVQKATEWALQEFNNPEYYGRTVALPISPPDGADIWCEDYRKGPGQGYDQQKITDLVMGLASKVAQNIQPTHPGKFISVLSYSYYGNIPSPSVYLHPNMFVVVTDFTRGGPDTPTRLKAFKERGVKTGSYWYFDVFQYNRDHLVHPGRSQGYIKSIRSDVASGNRRFYTEASSNWGSQGRTYWLATQLTWDPNQDEEVLLDDFYTNAFGPAAETMKRYFTRIDTRPARYAEPMSQDPMFGLAFRDLRQALAEADGDPAVQKRIRDTFLFLYHWYNWGYKYKYGTPWTLQELQAMVTFTTRTGTNGMISANLQHRKLMGVLMEDYGQTEAQVDALTNFNYPSDAEIDGWLNQTVDTWAGKDLIDANYMFPDTLNLIPAGSNAPKFAPFTNGIGNNLVPVKVLVTTPGPVNFTAYNYWYSHDWFWDAPDGRRLETVRIESMYDDTPNTCRSTAGCAKTVQAPEPGIYTLWLNPVEAGFTMDRPFGKEADVAGLPIMGPEDTFFYVPAGTPAFVIGDGKLPPNDHPSDKPILVTSPSGQNYSFSNTDFGQRNPEPGAWRIRFPETRWPDGNPMYRKVWILGIPPYMGHDPKYLLTVAGTATPPVTFRNEDVNQDGRVNLLDFSMLASKFGQTGNLGRTDINGDGVVTLLDFSLLASKFGT